MISNLVANERKRERQLINQGIEQGIERGIEQGIEQGVILEKAETAKALLGMGLTVEQVAKGTRLTVEDVEGIKRGLAH